MFKFSCFSCGEHFRISFENLYNKIAIQCPNCNSHVPIKAVESLRKLSEAYMDVIDVLYHSNTHESGFGISIQETDKVIPKQPDYYFRRKIPEDESFWKHRNKPFEPEKNSGIPENFNDPDLPY